MPTPPQFALSFPHHPAYAPAGFMRAASNEAALSWLERTTDWPGGRLALWGQHGCGKTHLLHFWAARTGAALRTGGALELMPALPEGGGLALDDAHQAPEEPLLHLLNATGEAGLPVLLAAPLPPARWCVRLPDLASRLRAITAVEIGAPEDSLLRALLVHLLSERQLVIPPALPDWLLLRLPRSPGALLDAVARLDHAALQVGGKLTRAVAAGVVAELDAAAPEGRMTECHLADNPNAAGR